MIYGKPVKLNEHMDILPIAYKKNMYKKEVWNT